MWDDLIELLINAFEILFAPIIILLGKITAFVFDALKMFFCWLCQTMLDATSAVVDAVLLLFPSFAHGAGDYRETGAALNSLLWYAHALNEWVPAYECFAIILISLSVQATLIGIRWLITFIPGAGV